MASGGARGVCRSNVVKRPRTTHPTPGVPGGTGQASAGGSCGATVNRQRRSGGYSAPLPSRPRARVSVTSTTSCGCCAPAAPVQFPARALHSVRAGSRSATGGSGAGGGAAAAWARAPGALSAAAANSSSSSSAAEAATPQGGRRRRPTGPAPGRRRGSGRGGVDDATVMGAAPPRGPRRRRAAGHVRPKNAFCFLGCNVVVLPCCGADHRGPASPQRPPVAPVRGDGLREAEAPPPRRAARRPSRTRSRSKSTSAWA